MFVSLITSMKQASLLVLSLLPWVYSLAASISLKISSIIFLTIGIILSSNAFPPTSSSIFAIASPDVLSRHYASALTLSAQSLISASNPSASSILSLLIIESSP